MPITTISGFYPWGSNYHNITNGDDVNLVDLHFQANQIPVEYQEAGLNLALNPKGAGLIVRNNPGLIMNGGAGDAASYFECYIPDDMDWSFYYTGGLGLNQCCMQIQDDCTNAVVSDVVVDGWWDGCKTPTSPGTRFQRCAFFRIRDDVCEFDQGLRKTGDSYEWHDNLAIGFGNGLSTRPGGNTPDAPGGHVIDVRRSVFVSNQSYRNAGQPNPYVTGKIRKTNNNGTVSYDFLDCVFAFDEDLEFESAPTSYVADNGNGDTVTTCTFVWLGAGGVPAKFGIGQAGQGWTTITGAGPHNHLGVSVTGDARDWLEAYIVAWLDTAGREKLATTVRAKIDWSKILSGDPPSRTQLLPGITAKLEGSSPTYTGPLFYVDSGAAGGGDGSSGTPWNSLAQVAAHDVSPGFAAGSQILLERGSIFREGLILSSSGSGATSIRLGDRGTGDRPKLIGSPDLDQSGGWTHQASGRWTHATTGDVTPTTLWFGNVYAGAPAIDTAAVEAGPAGTWFWVGNVLHLQSGGTEVNPTTVWPSITLNTRALGLAVTGSNVDVDHLNIENFAIGYRTGSSGGAAAGTNVNTAFVDVLRSSDFGAILESPGEHDQLRAFYQQKAAAVGILIDRNSAGMQLLGCSAHSSGHDAVQIGVNAGAGIVVDGCTLGGAGTLSPGGAALRRALSATATLTIRNSTIRSGDLAPTIATLWYEGAAVVTVEDSVVIHDGTWACNRPENGASLVSLRNRWWATSGLAASGATVPNNGAFGLWGGESGSNATVVSDFDVMISDAASSKFAAPAGVYYNGNSMTIRHGTLVSRGVAVGFRRRNIYPSLTIEDSIIYTASTAADAEPLELLFSFGDPDAGPSTYVPPNINHVLLWRAGAPTSALYIDGDAGASVPTASGVPDRTGDEILAGTVSATDGYLANHVIADPLFTSLSAGDVSLTGSSPAIDAASDLGNLGYDQVTEAAPTGSGSTDMSLLAAADGIYYSTSADFGAGAIPSGTPLTGYRGLTALVGFDQRKVAYGIYLESDRTTYAVGLGTFDEGTTTLLRTAAETDTAAIAGVDASGTLVDFPAGAKRIWVGAPVASVLNKMFRQIPSEQINPGDDNWSYSDELGANVAVRFTTALTAQRDAIFPAGQGRVGDTVLVRNPSTNSPNNVRVRIENPGSPGTYVDILVEPGRTRTLRKDADSPGWWTNYGITDVAPTVGVANPLTADLDGGGFKILGARRHKYERAGAQTLNTAGFKSGTTIEHGGGAATYTVPSRLGADMDDEDILIVRCVGEGPITWSGSGVTLHGDTSVLAASETAFLFWTYPSGIGSERVYIRKLGAGGAAGDTYDQVDDGGDYSVTAFVPGTGGATKNGNRRFTAAGIQLITFSTDPGADAYGQFEAGAGVTLRIAASGGNTVNGGTGPIDVPAGGTVAWWRTAAGIIRLIGATNETVVWSGNVDGGAKTLSNVVAPLADSLVISNRALTLADAAQKMLRADHATTPIVITVPLNSTVAFPIGTVININRWGAAAVSVAPEGAVVLQKPSDRTLFVRSQYEPISLWKQDTDTWLVFGGLAST